MHQKIIRTEGNSMAPLLRHGDFFLVNTKSDVALDQLPPGRLLYVQSSPTPILHRYMGQFLLKGDRNKDYDLYSEVLGLVQARAQLKNGELHFISYDRLTLRFLHRVQAFLSRRNLRGHPLHRIFSALSYGFGILVRAWENRL